MTPPTPRRRTPRRPHGDRRKGASRSSTAAWCAARRDRSAARWAASGGASSPPWSWCSPRRACTRCGRADRGPHPQPAGDRLVGHGQAATTRSSPPPRAAAALAAVPRRRPAPPPTGPLAGVRVPCLGAPGAVDLGAALAGRSRSSTSGRPGAALAGPNCPSSPVRGGPGAGPCSPSTSADDPRGRPRAAHRARRAGCPPWPTPTARRRRARLAPGLPLSYVVRADGPAALVDPPVPFTAPRRSPRPSPACPNRDRVVILAPAHTRPHGTGKVEW